MTAQVPEILLHRGQKLDLCANPLGEYLEKLPQKHCPEFASTSTACHRGYVGTWEIRDGYLYLVALQGVIRAGEEFVEADLKRAFPWVKDMLRAGWVTDQYRCPEGRLLSYVHHMYASRYERDRILLFDEGRLDGEWLILNPPDPIIYRIDENGRRSCVESTHAWDNETLPDPLGDADLGEAYKVWGRPPKPDDEEGYLVAACYNHPPR